MQHREVRMMKIEELLPIHPRLRTVQAIQKQPPTTRLLPPPFTPGAEWQLLPFLSFSGDLGEFERAFVPPMLNHSDVVIQGKGSGNVEALTARDVMIFPARVGNLGQ